MNEELKALLGDAYKENMTLEEVGEFFKGKKFADLSTGKYVDKDKYDTQVNNLTKQLNEKQSELKAKLTDEEKSALASQEQQKRIEELEKLLNQNTIAGNKNSANGILQGSRDILGIQATDNDFASFVDNITTEDSGKTNEIANYVSKVVKDAYEKGKKDALKDAMGDFGKGKGQGSSGKGADEVGKLGKDLASKIAEAKKPTYDYFKN